MDVNLEEKKGALDAIRRQIKVLNIVVLVIIYTLFFLVIRFLYVILDYIPKQSIVVILSILAGLVAIGLYLANSASKRAIRKIEEYSNKLNMLLTTTRDIREIVYGDILIDNIIDSSLKITGADAGSILLSEGDKNGVFPNEDEELISYFADQAAISITSTKFYEDQKNYETFSLYNPKD